MLLVLLFALLVLGFFIGRKAEDSGGSGESRDWDEE